MKNRIFRGEMQGGYILTVEYIIRIIFMPSFTPNLKMITPRFCNHGRPWLNIYNPKMCNIIYSRPYSISISKYRCSLGVQNFIKTTDSCKYIGVVIAMTAVNNRVMIDEQVNYKCLNTLVLSGTKA